MRKQVKLFMEKRKSDYRFKTVVASTLSMLIGFAFALYNGVLGVLYRSLWHGSICVYYFLLAAVRAILVRTQKKEALFPQDGAAAHRRKIYIATNILLLILNVSLIAPAMVMIANGRSYLYGLIPAIAMAAYTTYRITMSTIHYIRSRKSENLFVAELRTINTIDSLVAVLTLQNTLIVANGGMSAEMQTLSSWTSGGILLLITIVIIRSFLKIREIDSK